jgi:prolyl 4-hydroxylase
MLHQVVTTELREWIINQAKAGQHPDVVLQAMKASGWDEDVAVAAMEKTMQEYVDEQKLAASLPPLVPVPQPAMEPSALYVDAGDRQVHVVTQVAAPHIVVFGNLLSDEECDALINAAKPRMVRSMTVATRTGGEEIHVDRTSMGMFFERGETEVVTRLEARIARLLNWPVDHGEGLQILHYRPGAEYKPHYDYFDPHEAGTPKILQRGGQRVATLIMYLAEPVRGGGTTFPDLKLEVAPKRGNAVFFSYPRAHPSTLTLHGGAPVLEGEKWIATKWLRERVFK